jgi:DNA-directed RNA polymerase specialized sigma24 family protein
MNPPRAMIDEISTRWPLIHDPAQFVLRYAPAIEGYLRALVRDPDQVEEIRQDFLLRVLQKGFLSADNLKGRFRNYLKAAVRNAAISQMRRKTHGQADPDALAQVPDEIDDSPMDQEWLTHWRSCMLERVWESLELHERQKQDNHAYTVLRIYVDHHEREDSEVMAERAAAQLKKPMRSDAFRKQLSRARRLFAKLLVQEVVQTIESPTPDRIEDELVEVGLLADVTAYLPEDWRTTLA